MTMSWSILFGAIVGFSLGLTGGGGAIFAVPLLVYGLAVPPREAVGISLVAVGTTSFLGFLARWRGGMVDVKMGVLFALAGMLGAPLGSWLSGLMPEAMLLILFGMLMLVVAQRMWQKAAKGDSAAGSQPHPALCRHTAAGGLELTSRCVLLLALVGVTVGILTGLFGVGGGFVIVPALVLLSGMQIHRAIGTSLLVISLVSVSGVGSHLLAGRSLLPEITALFIAGGILGMGLGTVLARRLSSAVLQKVFAIAIIAVAGFVIGKTVFLPTR
ncbi:MAG: sulfite exporter TauE/SafE family protein [Bryobacteraceae bacterium]|nr:sulfite exporter TauE/SafE family protein [Bryobacteraceae bacterium]